MKLLRFFDFIFPLRCAHCNAIIAEDALCATCKKELSRYNTLFCAVCKARLPSRKKICHRQAPYILGAAFDFHSPAIRSVIHALKFRHIRSSGEWLGKELAHYATPFISPGHPLVIPIPLSRRRRNERGFNQAEIIAHTFSRILSLPLRTDILRRISNTKPQSELSSVNERARNVIGCFEAISIARQTCILIDDVTTSGSTLREAAEALKRAGARRVIALVAAKA